MTRRRSMKHGVMETPCTGCGRHVAGRTRAQRIQGRGGKHRVRHLCPHGEWCVSGHPLANQGWNDPDCPECLKARRAERGESEFTGHVRHFGNYGKTGKA